MEPHLQCIQARFFRLSHKANYRNNGVLGSILDELFMTSVHKYIAHYSFTRFDSNKINDSKLEILR